MRKSGYIIYCMLIYLCHFQGCAPRGSDRPYYSNILACFCCFVSRRSLPIVMMSDNASTYCTPQLQKSSLGCSNQRNSAQCWAGKVSGGNSSPMVWRVLGETNQPHQDGNQGDTWKSPHQFGDTPDSCFRSRGNVK